jgi:hypothetical protein
MNPFGGSALAPKPPEKGVFPLDRQGTVRKMMLCMSAMSYSELMCLMCSCDDAQCKKQAHEFLACLDSNGQDYSGG